MMILVQYLQKRGKAGWRYRRKVPPALKAFLGRGEIVVPLVCSSVSFEATGGTSSYHTQVDPTAPQGSLRGYFAEATANLRKDTLQYLSETTDSTTGEVVQAPIGSWITVTEYGETKGVGRKQGKRP